MDHVTISTMMESVSRLLHVPDTVGRVSQDLQEDTRAQGHPRMCSAAISNLDARIMIAQLFARGGHSAEIIMRELYFQVSFCFLCVLSIQKLPLPSKI